MKHKTLWTRAISSLALIAITLALPLSALAAVANEITGDYDTNKHGIATRTGANTYTVEFKVSAAGALSATDFIRVDLPDTEFPLTAGAQVVTVTTGAAANPVGAVTVTSATATNSGVNNYLLIDLGGAEIANSNYVKIAGISTTAEPATTGANVGAYAFSVSTLETDAGNINTARVNETGIAMLQLANTVSVDAVIREALILTIDDRSLNFDADPSVNGGQDNNQQTVLTVKSNAYDGFVVKAALADTALTANQLLGANHSVALDSAADGNGTNYVKFSAAVAGGLAGGTTASAAVYSGLTNVYQSTTGNTALVNAGTITVSHDLKVDYTTPADTYRGTITYTAYPTF